MVDDREERGQEAAATGLRIECAYDRTVPIGELKPHPKNPNTHPDDQVGWIARLLQTHGWREPITVSTRSGFIVRGHGRRLAAIVLGEAVVPVDYQDYASEEAELADLIADNRVAEMSFFNRDLLREDLQLLQAADIGIEGAGFDLPDLLALGEAADVPVEESDGEEAPPFSEDQVADVRTDRFFLVFRNEEEKAFWCRRLGVPVETPRRVFLPRDVASGAA
jgi:ParB-like chromosome segregation protein Spo0J